MHCCYDVVWLGAVQSVAQGSHDHAHAVSCSRQPGIIESGAVIQSVTYGYRHAADRSS